MQNNEDVQESPDCNDIDFPLHMIHAAFSSHLLPIAYRIETHTTFLNYGYGKTR